MTIPFPTGITTPLDWLDGILPRVPNAHIDTVKFEILVALQTFFRRSQCWRDWVGPIMLHQEQVHYSIELTDYKAELVSLLHVRKESDGTDLRVMLPESHFNIFEPGSPSYFHRTPEGLAQIWPPLRPGESERVFVFCSMAPIDLCIPDWIKHRHYDAIRAGVLGSMYLTPGPNYKYDLGVRYEKRFRAAMSAATQDALAAGTGIPQMVYTPVQVSGSQRMRAGEVASDGRHW